MKFTDFTTKEIFEHSVLKLALVLLSVTNIVFFVMLVMDLSKIRLSLNDLVNLNYWKCQALAKLKRKWSHF